MLAGAGLALASSPALAFSKPNNKERTYIMIKVRCFCAQTAGCQLRSAKQLPAPLRSA